jgi:hypothetical protein
MREWTLDFHSRFAALTDSVSPMQTFAGPEGNLKALRAQYQHTTSDREVLATEPLRWRYS